MRHSDRRPPGLLLAVWLLVGLLVGSVAHAQQTDETPAALETAAPTNNKETPPPATSPEFKPLPFEILPQIFHVRDKNGQLQAVPGMSYEELMRLWKQQHQVAVEEVKPAYSIESFDLSGVVTGTSAELVARFKIVVHGEQWVRVPLKLTEAVPREEGVYEGPGEHVLERVLGGEGLVVWIRGKSDEHHVLTLKLVANVEQAGPQSRMKLMMPAAAVSQLQLQVPLARAVARVSEGSTLDAVRPLAGGKTEIKVLGLAGEFELTWNPAETQVAGLPAILEASSEQRIRINGRSANTYAKLVVRSLGSAFDHFQVRLPPGADYIGTPENGVSLVAIDASSPSGKLYDVRLAEKTVGPVDVQLVTERVHDASQEAGALELAGFEVLGAVRQWGTISVQVEGNWQVAWGESSHVRSVDDVMADRSDEFAAGFEYFVQPYSLTARVIPQRTRIRVEPQYTLLVGSDDVRLEARLKYTIRGAKVRTLALDTADWEFDTIEPASLVNVDAALATADRHLTIPLLTATSGELELKLTARRRLETDAEELRIELPRPQGDALPADVAIVSDDPIELLPRLDECQGLTPLVARPEMVLPARQQEPLFYRTSGEAASFVAERRIHAQAISSALSSRVEVREDETRVEQLLSFQVAYQPAEHFTLIVPAGISPQRLSVLYEGVRMSPVALRDGAQSGSAATPVRVKLPAPVIGRCELRVNYARSHAKPPTQASALVTVPLVVPGEGQLTDNQLQVMAAEGLTASYPQGPWSREGRSSEPGDPAELHLVAPRAIGEVTLAISSKQDQTEAATTIERALIETDLTSNVRLDRAIFRVATSRRRLDVVLPEQADPRSVTLLVNGAFVAPEAQRQRTVSVPLNSAGSDHLLEIRYRFSGREPQGSQRFASPEIPVARWVQQAYWQVVLPPSEHLLFAPRGYTGEQQWAWSNGAYVRRPTRSQADLERWIVEHGPATIQISGDSRAGEAGNRYVFSAVGRIPTLELYTISRSRLVLWTSLPLLAGGLALIYLPRVRHPAMLLTMGLTVAGIAIVEPHLAILLAQAATVGLVLVGVAWSLARLSPRMESPPLPPARGSSYAMLERSVTELYHRSPSKSHPPSTATNPLIPAGPDVNS